jgi:hypothetical protein
VNLPHCDQHQRAVIVFCSPELPKDKARWLKDVEDILRPIRRPCDQDVMAAIRYASERLQARTDPAPAPAAPALRQAP